MTPAADAAGLRFSVKADFCAWPAAAGRRQGRYA
jgi:hypothetical protein